MSPLPTARAALLGCVAVLGVASPTIADPGPYERYVHEASRPERTAFAEGARAERTAYRPSDPWAARPANRVVRPASGHLGEPLSTGPSGPASFGARESRPPARSDDAWTLAGFRDDPRYAGLPPMNRAYDDLHCDDCDAGFCDAGCGCDGCQNAWTWQFLPRGVLYRSYLAGPKESRLGVDWTYRDNDEWIMDGTIGGRFGFVRWGTTGRDAEGWQLGFETAAHLRMNWTRELDVDGTDYRFGIPLEYSVGRWEWRIGYYHLSSHAGDEFLVRNNTLNRLNYIRDSINLGVAYFVTPDLRVYTELSLAFHTDGGAEPVHVQFGFDYSPIVCTCHGAPFIALNVLLREEVNFGGGVNVLAGWQWQNPRYDHLIRVGVRYYNGESTQYSFFDEHEELIGLGLWYDY